MSHYKPYPAYRDSGVEWIGKVPEHWDVVPLRHVALFKNSNVDKKTYDGQETVSLCNYTDVYYNEFITPELPFMQATASAAEIEQFSLEKGDVLITKDSEDPSDIGIPSLVAEEMPGVVCGYHLTMIRGENFDTARLLHRILQSHPTQAHFFVEAPGITRYGLSQDAIGDLRCCLPPIMERGQIADRLDRETARIDTLIAKKTEFIELLGKKRRGLITHAVTKGLDPKAKMKDSGVEWIGQVPEHWEVLRLANIGPLVKGNGGTKADDAEDGMPCIRYGDLYTTYDFLIHKIKKFIRPESAPDYTQIKYGDLLLAASGETFEEIGKSAVNLDERQAVCGGDVIILRPVRKVDPTFLGYAAGSVSAQTQKSLMGKGFTVIHVYGDSLRNLLIATPTDEEQKQIGVVIDRETARIDLLTAKTHLSIDLLKKRRSALITAAVTGQIDVREAVEMASDPT